MRGTVNVSWITFTGVTDNWDEPLPVGSVLQLLEAGPNGLPDALDPADPNLVGGDDTLLATLSIGAGGAQGYAGYFMGGPARFQSPQPDDVLFVRAFDLLSLEGASEGYYGEGALTTGFSDPDASPPPLPDLIVWDGGATTQFFSFGEGLRGPGSGEAPRVPVVAEWPEPVVAEPEGGEGGRLAGTELVVEIQPASEGSSVYLIIWLPEGFCDAVDVYLFDSSPEEPFAGWDSPWRKACTGQNLLPGDPEDDWITWEDPDAPSAVRFYHARATSRYHGLESTEWPMFRHDALRTRGVCPG